LKHNQPSGYTNAVEALLAGTAVVISDSSLLPEAILSLPGVYRYQAGSAESLIQVTKAALADSKEFVYRKKIQLSASKVLNASKLYDKIQAIFAS
jgi:hypothetical protein